MIAVAAMVKVANLVGSDAVYGALWPTSCATCDIRTPTNISYPKEPFPQQFSTISEKFPDLQRTNWVNGEQFLTLPVPDLCEVRVRILGHQLSHGSSLVLPARTKSTGEGDPLIVVLGGGRGCVLKSDDALAGIWIPLRGRLQCSGGNADGALLTGELRITEAEPNLHVSGRGNALWIAILGSRSAWRNALAGFSEVSLTEPLLLPAIHTADRQLRQHAAALARSIARGTADLAIEAVLDRIIGLQRELAAAIARCPGRTYAQRRQVFLRLQRVRNYLAANCHLEVDNDALARMASYSPWHFIRAFRAAYRQTPHAYLVEQRLRRARRLLRSSPLAIAEIALASGFENRCAFSRLFRQRFGTTAGAVRRNETENAVAPAA